MNADYKAKLLDMFQNNAGADMSDRDLLHLIILISNPRADFIKITDDILKKFGNLSETVNAPLEELLKIKGLTENMAVELKVLDSCAKRISAERVSLKNKSVLSGWNEFLNFCRQNMAYNDIEEFRVFLLDDKLHCFCNKILSKGTINQTVVHPREVVRFALNNSAAYLILAHNHPSGDCQPSNEDIVLTNEICEAFDGIGISVFDHLIVTKGEIFSFRKNGLISEFNKI